MIVIPMAGASQRFRDAGYALPKHRLDLHGRSVFAHSVMSFEACFRDESFLFIARGGDDAGSFVEREAAALGIASARVVVLTETTAGQADTVAQGLNAAAVPRSEPLTIFNIDTFRPGFRHPDAPWMATADGYLEVMRGDDPGFSYVRRDEGAPDQRVAETAEKRVISNLASTGLYYFRTTDLFLGALAETRATAAGTEEYVAPLYNALIRNGRAVHYACVPEEQVIFCGTPAQYEALAGSR